MNSYDRLVLKRHLRRQIAGQEALLKDLQPGTDVHEMALGYIQDARDSLARLTSLEQTVVVKFPHDRQTKE